MANTSNGELVKHTEVNKQVKTNLEHEIDNNIVPLAEEVQKLNVSPLTKVDLKTEEDKPAEENGVAEENDNKDHQIEVEALKKWIETEPEIPFLEDRILLRFLHSCYYDVEKTKKTLKLFLSMRVTLPQLFVDRDPLSPEMQKTMANVNLAQVKMSGNKNLWIWQLTERGIQNYDYVQDLKMSMLSMDAWILNNNDLQESDVLLVDAKDISFRIIMNMNMSIAKQMTKYQEDAMPIRITAMHIVNVPNIFFRAYAFMKPFLSEEVINKIHFHKSNSETLFEHISKEDLPSDLGGTLPSVEEHMKQVLQQIYDQRDGLIGDLFQPKQTTIQKEQTSTTSRSYWPF